MDGDPYLLVPPGGEAQRLEDRAVGDGLEIVVERLAGFGLLRVADPYVLRAGGVVHAQVVVARGVIDLHERLIVQQQLGHEDASRGIGEVAEPRRARLVPALDDRDVDVAGRDGIARTGQRRGLQLQPGDVAGGHEHERRRLVLAAGGDDAQPRALDAVGG